MNSKKLISGLALLFVLLLMTAASHKGSKSLATLRLGDVLPEIKSLASASESVTDTTSSYLLVHFWASYDGSSRADNIRWHRLFAKFKANGAIAYRGVSVDPDISVHKRTVQIDGLDEKEQFHIRVLGQAVANPLGTNGVLHTYLVDKRGVIKAIDPKPLELAKALNSDRVPALPIPQ